MTLLHSDWRWEAFLETGMPLSHFLVIDTLLSGGGMTMETLVNMTLGYACHYTRDGKDCRWNIQHYEIVEAVEALLKDKMMFGCTERDISVLTSFYQWSGIDRIAIFPIIGLYYLGFPCVRICQIIQKYYWWKMGRYEETVFPNKRRLVYYLHYPDHFDNRSYIISSTLTGVEAGCKDNAEVIQSMGEIEEVGPWCGEWWVTYTRGYCRQIDLLKL